MRIILIYLMMSTFVISDDPFQDAKEWTIDEINNSIIKNYHQEGLVFIVLPLSSFGSDKIEFSGIHYVFDGKNALEFSKKFRVTNRHSEDSPDGGVLMGVIAFRSGKPFSDDFRAVLYLVGNRVLLQLDGFKYQLDHEFEVLFQKRGNELEKAQSGMGRD